jgi:hypothetical protein
MNESHVSGHVNRLAGEEISWVGECPWTGGFCFGTYSGRLVMPLDQSTALGFPYPIADEAINDVAFAGDLMGVSTRSEVIIFERDPASFDRGPAFGRFARLGEPYGGGAHGIVATAAGGFVAPLGAGGLLLIDAGEGPDRRIKMRVGQIGQEALNVCKLARLGVVRARGEVVACAARRGGLVAITLDRGEVKPPIVGRLLNEFDLVDVASLQSPQWPLAVATLSSDGAMLLSRNVLEDNLHVLRLNILSSRAYSLLSAQGHLFVLTRDAMVVLPDLAARFLASESLGDQITGLAIPIQAADAFLAFDEVVFDCEDGTPSIAIDQLIGNIQGFESSTLSESPLSPKRLTALSNGFDISFQVRTVEESRAPGSNISRVISAPILNPSFTPVAA